MKKKKEVNFWRYLINFWSLLFFVIIVSDFIVGGIGQNHINIISTVYIGILAIYVGDKEFERWYNKHQGKHPGEVFVVIWTVLVFLLLIGSIFKENYKIPDTIVSAYIAVLTILVITNKSKQIYLNKKK